MTERWRRVSTLFDQALERPQAERAGWLEAECGGDLELVAEVLALLRAHGRPRGVLELSLDAVLDSLADTPSSSLRAADPEPSLAGTRVGRYQLVEQIGRGGMGVVYRAHDTRLGRDVALKFLPRELGRDSDARARFLAEARAVSALDHPAICTLHDFGESDDGQLYLVMGYYRGQQLAERLRQGPLERAEALALATRVAEGLECAHAAGVVHRDIKPSNVLLSERGPLILDFGVAKLGRGVELTRPGSVLGTIAYMSPEQARGEAVDARSDLWSLGALLYEALSGRRPYQADNELALLQRIGSGQPPELSALADPALEQLLARLLAPEREQRFQGAGELLEALRALRDDLQLPSTPARPLVLPAVSLPHPLTSFVGRERELAELRLLLEHARLLTLTGPGGSGKTRLALELARERAGATAELARFVDLSTLGEPELLASTIAHALGIKLAGAETIESLARALGERPLLLVLDNFEQLVSAAPELGQRI